jgi:hypothetical protein
MFTLSPTHEAFPHNRLRPEPKGVRRTYEASIAVVGAVIGLVLTVTADEILLTLGLFGLGLWLVAIGFVIFGRPRRAR